MNVNVGLSRLIFVLVVSAAAAAVVVVVYGMSIRGASIACGIFLSR